MQSTQTSCAEDARLPNTESEVEIPDEAADAWSRERIGRFDIRINFCMPDRDALPNRAQRVERLTAWLLSQWLSEYKGAEHAECGTAD